MKKSISIFCSILGALITCQTASAQPISLFGMYQSKNVAHSQIIKQLEQDIKAFGCSVLREGGTFNGQGNYQLEPSNSFFVIHCEQSFIAQQSAQAIIDNLHKQTKNLVLLEGVDNQTGKPTFVDSGTNRSYIFKLSDYNNISPKLRDLDLAKLNTSAQSLEQHYMTEAFIRVSDAYGIERPDELVVIYYDSADDGEKFRENNPELMAQIGQFNKDHLSRFSYIPAKSNR